jgi:hypothetical protein
MIAETSPQVASKAAAILAMSDQELVELAQALPEWIRSIAASALAQREPGE